MIEHSSFSDYLVFVDESGDHNLTQIDKQFPVFVLLFAIIRKDDYTGKICPDIQKFKFKFWGHDEVVLHEREIRKPRDKFQFLNNKTIRDLFMDDLNTVMINLPVTVIAIIIDKLKYIDRYRCPVNPYDYAMEAGLERVYKQLYSLNQINFTTTIIVEQRGRKEDRELELAFRRVCDGSNYLNQRLPFNLLMTSKASNSIGLQLTDLMARPIGNNYLYPDNHNRAFEIIKSKLRQDRYGNTRGWGIKVLP